MNGQRSAMLSRWRSRTGSSSSPGDRVRVPPPLLKHRLPSGRGATEQPNVTGDGEAALSSRFWLALALTGVFAGLFGGLLMMLLYAVEHLGFNYRIGGFESAVMRSSDLRRVTSLFIGGVIGAIGWFAIRRWFARDRADMDDVLWNGDAVLSPRRGICTSVLSEVVVGLGASIGREAAPKLMGGVSGSVIAAWFGLTPGQRRLIVACGGGAGLAAVYNVPFAGALFTAEILYGNLALPTMLPALGCSSIATIASWALLPNRAAYAGIPTYHLSTSLVIWAVVVGPLIGLFAAGYIRLIGYVSHHQASGRRMLLAMPCAFVALGLIGFAYPELFGNGKDMAQSAFLGRDAVALLAALAVLKPLATALCVGSGASGGLITPTLSTGAVLGGSFGSLWNHLWSIPSEGAFALVGATAMMGAAMQAPLTALAMIVELIHGGTALMVPMILATVGATALARRIDGYSIYSARLSARS